MNIIYRINNKDIQSNNKVITIFVELIVNNYNSNITVYSLIIKLTEKIETTIENDKNIIKRINRIDMV